MADVSQKDFQQMKGERDAARKELDEVKTKLEAVERAHATLQTTHSELMAKTGYKEVKPYEYADDECRPVNLNDVCPKCGFDYRPEVNGRPNPEFQLKPDDGSGKMRYKAVHPITRI